MPASQKPPSSAAPKKIKVCSSFANSKGVRADRAAAEKQSAMRRRKVRIICTDPEATESSSDEQEDDEDDCFRHGRSVKRVVLEMFIHANSTCEEASTASNFVRRDCELSRPSPALSPPSLHGKNLTRCSSKRAAKKWRLRPALPRLLKAGVPCEKNLGKYIGVRQRKWGKWTTEFREPAQDVRMCLGTFDIAKESAIAFDKATMKLKGSEIESSCSSEFPTSLDCWPSIGMSADELLACSELDGMEECIMTAHSPSSVLDLPASLDSASPSSVLDRTYSDEYGSPLYHQSKDVKLQCNNAAELGTALVEKGIKVEAFSATEPLFEAFGKFSDCTGNEDQGFACNEFPAFRDECEDEGANLMSFELDAEALTWINIQP